MFWFCCGPYVVVSMKFKTKNKCYLIFKANIWWVTDVFDVLFYILKLPYIYKIMVDFSRSMFKLSRYLDIFHVNLNNFGYMWSSYYNFSRKISYEQSLYIWGILLHHPFEQIIRAMSAQNHIATGPSLTDAHIQWFSCLNSRFLLVSRKSSIHWTGDVYMVVK